MLDRVPLVTLLIVGGAFLLAQVDWPGMLADCVLSGSCDCEAVGSGGIRQPVNAFSSLALIVLGAVLVTPSARSPLQLFRVAIVIAGSASFISHAAVTDWSHTLDSLGVKAVVLFLVIYPLTRPRPILAPYVAALVLIWAMELAWPASGRTLLAVLVVAALVVNLPREVPKPAMLWAGILLLAALAAWWLGRSGSPLCEPDSVFQPHAVWHLLVAGGLAALHHSYVETEPR